MVLYGGSGCFTWEQKVLTKCGSKRISEIKHGDLVYSFNHEKNENEYAKVVETHKYNKPTEKIYRIKLKDGTLINVTENHKFFYGGAYLKIKDILVCSGHVTMEKNT